MALNLVQTRIDFAHIVLLQAFSERLEAERFRIHGLRHAQDIKYYARCRPVVSLTNDHTVADNEEQFALVIIPHPCSRVNSTAKRVLVFGVGRDLAHDELVDVLGDVLASELERGKELDRDDSDEGSGEGSEETVREVEPAASKAPIEAHDLVRQEDALELQMGKLQVVDGSEEPRNAEDP